MKAWEMELNRREKDVFKEILHELKETRTATCPHEGVAQAVDTGYCGTMCGRLFPTVFRKKIKQGYPTMTCPCSTVSLGHKIKVVQNLLKFNKVEV